MVEVGNESAEQVYKRMRQEQADELAKKPPKMPIPKTFRNKAFQEIHEQQAYKPAEPKGNEPAAAMPKSDIEQAVAGLKMLANMGGMESVRQMAKEAGVKIGGDLFESITKHLEAGGTMDRKQPKTDGTIGRESTATTERGTTVNTRYRVMEADDLIASHDLNGNHNEAFPKELQPRDRTRTASKLQVEQISNELDFNRLGESSLASSGSPIIASDKVVESGNGRILGVKLAYEKGNAASKAYKAALAQNAANFGLDAAAIEGMKKPVLVRERTSDVDRVQFAKEANESGVSTMSAAEQAKVDAEALNSFLIDQYEGGDLKAIKNRPFVNAFMENVVSTADRNKFITEKVDKDGMKVAELSKDGENRIKNAMFAKAYGDADLLTKKAELDDESNVKNVLQVLEDNAVRYAKVKAEIEAGRLHNHDLSEDLVAAVKKLDELREHGESAINYLNQPTFFESELSEESRAILFAFEKNKRSKANIDSILNAYMDELEALGDPNELDMFAGLDDSLSNNNINKMDLISTAVARHQPELVEDMKRIAANDGLNPIEDQPQPEMSKEELSEDTSKKNKEVERLEKEIKAALRHTSAQKTAVNGLREYFDKIQDEDGRTLIDLGSHKNETYTKYAKKPKEQNEYVTNRLNTLQQISDRIGLDGKVSIPDGSKINSTNILHNLEKGTQADVLQDLFTGEFVGSQVSGDLATSIRETSVDTEPIRKKYHNLHRAKLDNINYATEGDRIKPDHYVMTYLLSHGGNSDIGVHTTFNNKGEITNSVAFGPGHRKDVDEIKQIGIDLVKQHLNQVAERNGSDQINFTIAGLIAAKERKAKREAEKAAQKAAEEKALAEKLAKERAKREAAAAKENLTELVQERKNVLMDLRNKAFNLEITARNHENGIRFVSDITGETLVDLPTHRQRPNTDDPAELAAFERELIRLYKEAYAVIEAHRKVVEEFELQMVDLY